MSVFGYRAGEIWKQEFFYAVIFIIDQIRTSVTILKAFRMYDQLNKHILKRK